MAIIRAKTPDGKAYKLNESDEIHRGGEGKILAIKNSPGLVAKIYHKNITPISQTKFDFLSKLDKSLFVVPQELLLDEKTQKIIGFTMEYIDHYFFPLSSIFGKNFCARRGIDQKFKRKIGEMLINAMHYAHKQQLVLGDFNQYNILINKRGELKLIDTDSYQVPGCPHTGIMLDDIRDYLYGGVVNPNSDYFALSVLVFYAFTFTHPFKGIHKKYKKISERMIHKIPVFVSDPELKPPKCFMPLTDNLLQKQFEKLYLNGERFLLNLKDAGKIISAKAKPPKITTIVQDDLVITPIVQNYDIQHIMFRLQNGYVETQDNFIVFDARNKGYLTKKYQLSKKQWDRVYLSRQNVFVQKGNKLFHYKTKTDITEIANFRFPSDAIIHQYEDILVVIGNNIMNWLYLNDVINQSVRNKRIDVFQKGFRNYNSLMQNAGGIFRLFYNTGKEMATVKTVKPPKDLYQQANVGLIQYVENNRIENRYFRIDGLNMIIQTKGEIPEFMIDFAYMPIDKQNGYIFEPADNQIKLIRTQDFLQTSTINCSLITQQSKLQYSKAGIIAWEENSVYLLNKR